MKTAKILSISICTLLSAVWILPVKIHAAFGETQDELSYVLQSAADTLTRSDDAPEQIMLSDAFAVSQRQTAQTEKFTYYFVLTPDSVAGILWFGINDGTYSSGASFGTWDALQKAYQNQEQIAVAVDGTQVYLCEKSSGKVCLLNRYDAQPEQMPESLQDLPLQYHPITRKYTLNGLPGDVNTDGSVDAADAQLVLNEYAEAVLAEAQSTLTQQQRALAQVIPQNKWADMHIADEKQALLYNAQAILEYYAAGLVNQDIQQNGIALWLERKNHL